MREYSSWIRLLTFQTIVYFIFVLFISTKNLAQIIGLNLSLIFIEICYIIDTQIIEIEKKKLNQIEKYRKKLNPKEQECVIDVVNFIKSINSNIEIPKFDIYTIKLNFIECDGAAFAEFNLRNEYTIYIKQNVFNCKNETKIFMTILHEILHVMHHTDEIFTNDFCEGLNQYLTIWLMKTYCQKYNLEKQ